MQAYSDHWDLIQQVLRDHVDRGDLRYSEHANERMDERGITRKTVEHIVYRNRPTEMHEPFQYPYGENPYANPDPVFTVVGEHEGRKIAVALALKHRGRSLLFTVITAFEASGRHI